MRYLDDASLGLLPIDGFEPWVYSDLVQNPVQETVDPRRYCQIAVAAVTMGDLNAVHAVEVAHRRQLLSVGSLQTWSVSLPGCVFHRSATLGDVFLDDLVIPAMVHFPVWTLTCGHSHTATSSTVRDRRQSFRRQCLLDACVFGNLESIFRMRKVVFSDAGLGYEFDAHT